MPSQMLLDSLFHQFEYQADLTGPFGRPGVDLDRLYEEIGWGGD